jgi:hypothetical protein
MANRVTHTLQYADNLSSLTSASSAAACNDWRRSDADSMSARDAFDPTTDAGYLSSRYFPQSQTIDQPLAFVGESIYEGLGLSRCSFHKHIGPFLAIC